MPKVPVQEQRTELYILFPEYIDAQHQGSSPYIYTIGTPIDGNIPSEVDGVLDMLDFFNYEVCYRFYDGENILNVVRPYTASVYPDVETNIYSQLHKNGCLDWREEVFGGETYPSLMLNGMNLGADTCGKVYSRHKINTDELKCHAVLLASNHVLDRYALLATLKDSRGNLAQFPICQTIRELYDWFVQNRLPQRRFDYNKKHGENRNRKRKVNGEWVCPLRCHRSEAQKLLERAIGNMDINIALWYYDDARGYHIYFENQGEFPQPAFHGYHVEPGDDNFDNIDPNKLSKVYP